MRVQLLLIAIVLATAGIFTPVRADERAPLPEALKALIQEERFATRASLSEALNRSDAWLLDIRPGSPRPPYACLDANEIGRLIKALDGVKIAELSYNADPKLLPLFGKLPGIGHLFLSDPRGEFDGIDAAIRELLPLLPDLTSLTMNNQKLGNSGLEAIALHPKIQKLRIYSPLFDDNGIRQLRNMRQLKELGCSGLSGSISDAVFPAFAELSNLVQLDIGSKKITGSELGQLARLEKLKSLSLIGTAVTDDSLPNLAGCTQLRHLDLAATRVTDRGLAALAPLKELRSLRLDKAPITDHGLAALASLEHLRVLGLDNAPITDGAILNLARLPSLEGLNVGETNLTDAACGHMSKLPKLKALRLSFTYVTDAGVPALADCKQLQSLQLWNCALTDRCVGDLCKLKSLTSLYVNQTDITPAGLQALRDGLGEHCTVQSGGTRDPDRRGPWIPPAFRTRRPR